MTPEHEKYLWDRLPPDGKYDPENTARHVIWDMVQKGMIKNVKQGWRTLEKWDRQGKWTWGVTIDLGWKEKP